MTAIEFIGRGLAWFVVASVGMLPYFAALRRYRSYADPLPACRGRSTADLLDNVQSTPALEALRMKARKRLWIGLAVYVLFVPLFPVFLNA